MAFDQAERFPLSGKKIRRAGQIFNIDAYGAKGDAVESWTGVAVNGDATFTDATANWSAADIGKAISIYRASSNAGQVAEKIHTTTIASINSATSIELTAAPSASRSGTYYVYGSVDDAAFDAVVAAANVRGGVVKFTSGKTYLFTSGVVIAHSNVTIEAWGANIRCPALPFVQNVASSAAEWLIRTTGKTHEGAADGANLKATTTASLAVAKGAQVVRVASTTGIARGQLIWLQSSEAFTDANARGKYHYAIVTHVDAGNSDVYFDRATRMTLDPAAAGGPYTITVKCYSILENINILGGDWRAGYYAGDAGNGGGQSLFNPQYVHGSLFAPERVEGFQGYAVYPMFSADAVARGGVYVGRPQDIAFVEGQTSGWYGMGVQSSIDCTIEGVESFRQRHLIDSYYSAGAKAHFNTAHYSRTGAFRSHNGSVDWDYSYNEVDAVMYCTQHDSGWGRDVGNHGTVWGYGVYALHTGTMAETGEIIMDDNHFRTALAPDGVTGYPALACRVATMAKAVRVRRNTFDWVALGNTGPVVRFICTGAQKFNDFEFTENTIKTTSGVSTDYPFECGDTSKAFTDKGIVKGNKISAPSAAKLIRVIGGSGGDPLDDFEVCYNQCLDPTSAASEVVDTLSGTFGSNFREYLNNGLAFTLDGGGGGSSFGAWTLVGSPVARFGAAGGDIANNPVSGQFRYRTSVSGKGVLVQFQFAAAPTWSTDSGNYGVEVPGMEAEATVSGQSMQSWDSTFAYPASMTSLSWSITSDGSGNSLITFNAHASGQNAVNIGTTSMSSGTAFDFRGAGIFVKL